MIKELYRSTCPMIGGWYLVENKVSVPSILQTCWKPGDLECLQLSDNIKADGPYTITQPGTNNFATLSAVAGSSGTVGTSLKTCTVLPVSTHASLGSWLTLQECRTQRIPKHRWTGRASSVWFGHGASHGSLHMWNRYRQWHKSGQVLKARRAKVSGRSTVVYHLDDMRSSHKDQQVTNYFAMP